MVSAIGAPSMSLFSVTGSMFTSRPFYSSKTTKLLNVDTLSALLFSMESIWRSFILSEKDDWTKTKDPAERRKIQNRLSQRAKRVYADGLYSTQLTDFRGQKGSDKEAEKRTWRGTCNFSHVYQQHRS